MNTSIIIDDDLILDVDTSTITSNKSNLQKQDDVVFDELLLEIDKLELAINNLESSLNPKTTSNLSQPNRDGIYEKTGLITNIVIGVIIALILMLLMI